MLQVKPLLLHGTFVHCEDGELKIFENHYLTVQDGVITAFGTERPTGEFQEVSTTATQFFLPGLIDTHIHAPQYTYCGCGLDKKLLDWLNHYAFPCEARLHNLDLAQRVYRAVVQRTLSYGTTTACYFATINTEASIQLADICKFQGQRAFVGKVSMDRNSPDYYIEQTGKAIEEAERFVSHVEAGKSEFVKPVLAPRFVPSCTAELMKGLSDIQKRHKDVIVQSHVSENLEEIKWVSELHPECSNYTAVYGHFGLLDGRTILAHGVHLTDEELELLRGKPITIAHCPSSNFQLFSGACDVRRLQAAGVAVSLGTDVAGGECPSMIHAMRNALVCSRSCLFTRRALGQAEGYAPLGVADVLSLATEAGAKALGIDDKVGNFKVGKQLDALLVDMDTGMADCFGYESIMDLVDKFVHLGDDRNILRVYVNGRLVKKV